MELTHNWAHNRQNSHPTGSSRRRFSRHRHPLLGILCLLLFGIGCTSSLIRPNAAEESTSSDPEEERSIRLVRDMARIWGLRPVRIEGIGLVTGLPNTGSDPPTSAGRDMLLNDMRRRKVDRPVSILSSPSTAMAVVRTQLPAGVRKGDRLDIEVSSPSNSTTTSLRSGWLMPTRLQEMAVLGNRIREGHLMGMAEGSLIVKSLLESESNDRAETKARVLGGAVSNIDRKLGLVLMSEHHSVRSSAMLGNAINARFHRYDRGTKTGVATPKRDNFIELDVHRTYRRNLVRYVRVIQAIPVRGTPHERLNRIHELEPQLLEPKTALRAAVDLEAIGVESLPALRKGLQSNHQLVRFAAAEALAYMNEIEAVPHLLKAAQTERALRWHALTALSSMRETEARDALAELLHEPSDESRYGAFKALIEFNPRDPAAHGEIVGETLAMHRIPSETEPLVHIRRTERPEIVIFGDPIRLQTPLVIMAGKRYMVKSEADNRLKISAFTAAEKDRARYCDNDLSEVIRTIVKIGGSYTDIVSSIMDAKRKGSLTARVKFDAIPQPGREYEFDPADLVPEDEEDFAEDQLTNEAIEDPGPSI